MTVTLCEWLVQNTASQGVGYINRLFSLHWGQGPVLNRFTRTQEPEPGQQACTGWIERWIDRQIESRGGRERVGQLARMCPTHVPAAGTTSRTEEEHAARQ